MLTGIQVNQSLGKMFFKAEFEHPVGSTGIVK